MSLAKEKEYLGDSVYVGIDHDIVLTTNNGYPDDPRNIIYLDSTVLLGLIKYVIRKYPDLKSHLLEVLKHE